MIASKQIAFGKAAGKRKPYAYKVEYLQCDGASYFDIDMYADELANCSIEFLSTAGEWGPFCFMTGQTNSWKVEPVHTLTLNFKSGDGIVRGAFVSDGRASDAVIKGGYANNVWHEMAMDLVAGCVVMDGEIIKDDIQFELSDRPNCRLLALAQRNDISGVMPSGRTIRFRHLTFAKWIEGLVYDLIPVVDFDGVPCVFNKVDGTLLYNAGTGAFTAGPRI